MRGTGPGTKKFIQVPTWMQGLKHSGHPPPLSQVHYQGARWETKQPKLKPIPIWYGRWWLNTLIAQLILLLLYIWLVFFRDFSIEYFGKWLLIFLEMYIIFHSVNLLTPSCTFCIFVSVTTHSCFLPHSFDCRHSCFICISRSLSFSPWISITLLCECAAWSFFLNH